MANETIYFTGIKDGINIRVNDNADFISIREALRQKAGMAAAFISDTHARISFSGQSLPLSQQQELTDILSTEYHLNVSLADQEARKIVPGKPAEHHEPLKANESVTMFHDGALRSGQVIRYVGSVVVLGDVNPGSEIVCGGNVIVLGSLKGTVHAGAGGNPAAFISAGRMLPIQLRICDIITYIPEDKKKKNIVPSYAFIQDGQIFVAPLVNS